MLLIRPMERHGVNRDIPPAWWGIMLCKSCPVNPGLPGRQSAGMVRGVGDEEMGERPGGGPAAGAGPSDRFDVPVPACDGGRGAC